MDYMTIKEASVLWKIDGSRIGKLLRDGKIIGAEKQGGHWYIPKGAPRPQDGRTRASKGSKFADFRFPLLINRAKEQFYPPLSDEELLLRQAQADFFACDFEKANAGFALLKKSAKNIHIRLCVLLFQCLLAAEYKKGEGFQHLLNELNLELAKDIPYKREMELLRPWLYSFLGLYKATAEWFTFEPDYEYHSSVYPLLSYLSFYHGIQENMSASNLDTYAIACRQLERDGNYYEAQELNAVLFYINHSLANKKAAFFHLKRVLVIAEEHNLVFLAACYESVFPDVYRAVLQEFPKEFSEKILRCSARIYDSYASFASSCNISDMYTALSKEDHQYILYAVQGFKYKEIAGFMNISERTVAAKYSRIFDKLGIKSRQGLLRLFENAAKGKNES